MVKLDDRELFSFEMPLHVHDLLICARAAIKLVMNAGLTAQNRKLGQLSEPQMKFMNGLNSFLCTHASFGILVE